MTPTIQTIDAHEILDSRGNPTLRVHVRLADGTVGVSSVPSGAPPARMRPSSCATATPPATAARGY
jgi:enolase